MDRFYRRSIDILKGGRNKDNIQYGELVDDINDYVQYLEHEKAILVNELSIFGDKLSCLTVLQRLGFLVKQKHNGGTEG